MGKGGMGMVGTNFSEGVKKHYNPKWDGGVKPAHEPREQNGAVFFGGAGVEPVFFPGHAPAGAGPGGASLVPEYKRKPDPRKTGTVDWASRFAEDERFGGAKSQWQAEQQGSKKDVDAAEEEEEKLKQQQLQYNSQQYPPYHYLAARGGFPGMGMGMGGMGPVAMMGGGGFLGQVGVGMA
eukprot:CAMPEP_0181367730 /NCGR_PEP_ID=MMETSP1106-20121128/11615_1 /TAXON_ID=81844 /ORGANISM="Mantoniella antarctica, Strain SL-175" /LENGTH=179 /DNA_ID=CAMNT_0023483609 /DNA_START=182 /DNA_END=718 /DNA_ORIENTATION=-